MSELKSMIEALLMTSGEPLNIERLQMLCTLNDEKPKAKDIRDAIAILQQEYQHRAIELHEVSSGFRIQVKNSFAELIKNLLQKQPQRYSRAVMETLAIIAYKQPITRAEIEAIRGVVVSTHIVKTLMDRGWIDIVGYKEVPGRPSILATTKNFLDDFNLKNLEELPPLLQFTQIDELEEISGAGVQVTLDFNESIENNENASPAIENP